ncbi:MAG: VPLPA-CTERM sorting domain-containing protein [Gammaproteobacteria bacterium]|nr:VPLPA-CTERM sorting domain-containing protein [Gammaproteobacteria bacterium]
MNIKSFNTLLITALFTGGLATANAAPVQVSYDFTSGGGTSSTIGAGFGNALRFNDIDGDNSSSENLTITAWGATGADQGSGAWGDSLQSAQISRWNTGLGACNRSEGLIGSYSNNCDTNSEHQVDNSGYDDFVLFAFDNIMAFDQLVIDPFFTSDIDLTFWIGTIGNTDLTGLDDLTLLSAGFSNPLNALFYGATYSPQTINLGGATGNVLLVSAQRDLGSPDDDDYFKIASLRATTTEIPAVPVPAAGWLFASGLLALVHSARRKGQFN